jgi:5-methylcytosine-specific restriction endonuclease McrA
VDPIKKRDHRKRRQLGLPIGTASHRLRKLILFRLVQETGRDICFRCSLPIETVDELVFDHKEPWLDNSTELFWDPDNVAFSHARCNSAARRTLKGYKFGPSPLRKVGPPGMAWCTRHARFLPASAFDRNRAKWSGLQSNCRKCQASLPQE